MADSTEHSSKMNRQEFADFLRELADEFEGDGDIDVPVGNKSIELHPPESLKRDIEVVERSSILRGSKEAIELDVRWKAAKGRSDSSDDAESEEETAPDLGE